MGTLGDALAGATPTSSTMLATLAFICAGLAASLLAGVWMLLNPKANAQAPQQAARTVGSGNQQREPVGSAPNKAFSNQTVDNAGHIDATRDARSPPMQTHGISSPVKCACPPFAVDLQGVQLEVAQYGCPIHGALQNTLAQRHALNTSKAAHSMQRQQRELRRTAVDAALSADGRSPPTSGALSGGRATSRSRGGGGEGGRVLPLIPGGQFYDQLLVAAQATIDHPERGSMYLDAWYTSAVAQTPPPAHNTHSRGSGVATSASSTRQPSLTRSRRTPSQARRSTSRSVPGGRYTQPGSAPPAAAAAPASGSGVSGARETNERTSAVLLREVLRSHSLARSKHSVSMDAKGGGGYNGGHARRYTSESMARLAAQASSDSPGPTPPPYPHTTGTGTGVDTVSPRWQPHRRDVSPSASGSVLVGMLTRSHMRSTSRSMGRYTQRPYAYTTDSQSQHQGGSGSGDASLNATATAAVATAGGGGGGGAVVTTSTPGVGGANDGWGGEDVSEPLAGQGGGGVCRWESELVPSTRLGAAALSHMLQRTSSHSSSRLDRSRGSSPLSSPSDWQHSQQHLQQGHGHGQRSASRGRSHSRLPSYSWNRSLSSSQEHYEHRPRSSQEHYEHRPRSSQRRIPPSHSRSILRSLLTRRQEPLEEGEVVADEKEQYYRAWVKMEAQRATTRARYRDDVIPHTQVVYEGTGTGTGASTARGGGGGLLSPASRGGGLDSTPRDSAVEGWVDATHGYDEGGGGGGGEEGPPRPPTALEVSSLYHAAANKRAQAHSAAFSDDIRRVAINVRLTTDAAAAREREVTRAHITAAVAAEEHTIQRETKATSDSVTEIRQVFSDANEWFRTYKADVQLAVKRQVEERRRAEAEAKAKAEEEARRRAAEEEARQVAAAAAEAERVRAELARTEAVEAEARVRREAEQLATANATATAAAGGDAGAGAVHAAAPNHTSSAAQPGDFLEEAVGICGTFEESAALVKERLALGPDAYAHSNPASLSTARPRDAIAVGIFAEVKKAINRHLEGALDQLYTCGQLLNAQLDHAKIQDSEHPLVATPEHYGGGIFTLYTCDLIVSLLCQKIKSVEMPVFDSSYCTALMAGDEDGAARARSLAPIFALSRVLLFLSAKQPVFLLRYRAFVYRTAPIAIPIPPSPTATIGPETRDIMSRMLGVYAGLMQGKTHEQAAANRNPFGIKHAWAWAARLLNAPPSWQAARALQALFVVAGYELHTVYGVQFIKLCDVLYNRYLPLLRATPGMEDTVVANMTVMLAGSTSRFTPSASHIPLLQYAPKGRTLPASSSEQMD